MLICRITHKISPIVEFWKGLTKYASMAAMGGIAAVSVLHYLVAGRNKVKPAGRRRGQAARGRSPTMTTYDVEPGDAVHPGDPVIVDRYTAGARVNHWITATCLVLLAISGMALFYPSFFFLTALFGGGQWTRAIHPWIGVVLFFSFSGMFLRFWKANLWRAEDGTWLARLRYVLTNDEERLPEVGKYNAGQKVVFWSMSILIIVLDLHWGCHLGSIFLSADQHRAETLGNSRSLACRCNHHLRVDCPRLCGVLGTRHHRRYDPRPGHRRMGMASPPQMA